MEALGVFGINWKLLLVQAVNFGILLLVLWYFLYRPLMNMLEERQHKIERGVKDAEEAQEVRKQADEEKQSVVAEAHNTAESIVSGAKTQAQKEKEEIVQSAQGTKEKMLSDAQSQADAEKQQILSSAQKEVAQMATVAAAQILRDKTKQNGK